MKAIIWKLILSSTVVGIFSFSTTQSLESNMGSFNASVVRHAATRIELLEIFHPLTTFYHGDTPPLDSASQIGGDSYYCIHIDHIYSMKGGYYIEAHTIINDSIRAFVKIISFKEKCDYHLQSERLRVGKLYWMKLSPYFRKQIPYSVEYKQVYDIVAGNNSIAVLATGSFSNLFLTDNLQGLRYIDSTQISVHQQQCLSDSVRFRSFIEKAIIGLNYPNNQHLLFKIADTIQIKEFAKGLSRCRSVGYSPSEKPPFHPPRNINKKKWLFDSWNKLFGDSNESESFSNLVKNVLLFENYNESEIVDTAAIVIEKIQIHFLQCRGMLITTRVSWKDTNQTEINDAILIIKKEYDQYILVGALKQ